MIDLKMGDQEMHDQLHMLYGELLPSQLYATIILARRMREAGADLTMRLGEM